MTDDPTNCDVIDVTTTAQGHLDWVRHLIAHRAPGIDPSEIAEAFALPLDGDSGIPPRIAEQILLVLDRMADRTDGFDNRLRVN